MCCAQLLINFTNEKLQQHFNTHIFKNEEALYEAEGVDCVKVGFADNQPTLDLLEARTMPQGVLPTLDEMVKVGSATDETFHKKVH